MVLHNPHLTSHSRMSGSRWVITLSWLSGSWRSFLYSSYMYPCHLFLISSASVRSIPFLSLLSPSLHEMFPWFYLIFLKRCLFFPILLFSSISLCFLLLGIWNPGNNNSTQVTTVMLWNGILEERVIKEPLSMVVQAINWSQRNQLRGAVKLKYLSCEKWPRNYLFRGQFTIL